MLDSDEDPRYNTLDLGFLSRLGLNMSLLHTSSPLTRFEAKTVNIYVVRFELQVAYYQS